MTAARVSGPELVGARRRVSPAQLAAFCVLTIAFGLLLLVDWVMAARLVVVLHLLFGTGFLVLRATAVAARLLAPPRGGQPAVPAELPRFTLLCPLYKEPLSIRNLVGALSLLDYPRSLMDVILLIEADDEDTARAVGQLPHFVRVERVPPGLVRTKPNALNHGFLIARGDIIGVYDAEDRPEPDQLLKVAAAFATGGDKLACVQARLNYYNRDDGIITRLFALEYALHFDWFLPGLTAIGAPLPLGGTSNFVRRDALIAVGGWDAFNVTEDADLGLRLGAHGYRLATVDSTTFEEATDTPRRWIRQRSRWLKGYLQTWLVHLRRPVGPANSLVLHFGLAAVVVGALVNPVTWIAYLGWRLFGFGALDPVFAGVLGPACLLLFVGGTAAHIWFMLLAPLQRGWFELIAYAPFLPFYWVLQSLAGYKGLFEFFVRPHHWDKTDHSAGEDSSREASLA